MIQLFTVIGAGKFGTALAHVINTQISALNLPWKLRCYDLTDDHKPDFCQFTTNLEEACFLDDYPNCQRHWIITAIPAVQVEVIAEKINAFNLTNPTFLLVSKGVSKSGKFVSQLLEEKYGSKYELTTIVGPHFANDLINQAKTISAIGCSKELEAILKTIFGKISPLFSSDVLGIQIASVMKNMAAFCCGIASGIGMSESTCATVFALCMEDTKKLLNYFKCDSSIVSHPAIVADWIMCCTSRTSRNFDAGYAHATLCEKSCSLVESLKSIESLHSYLNDKISLPSLNLVLNSLHECDAAKHLDTFLNIELENIVK